LATRRNCTNICTAVPSHQAASHTTWHRFKGRLRWMTTPWRRRPVRAANESAPAPPGQDACCQQQHAPPRKKHTRQVSTAVAAHIRAGQISLPAGAAVDIGMPAQACVQGAVLGAQSCGTAQQESQPGAPTCQQCHSGVHAKCRPVESAVYDPLRRVAGGHQPLCAADHRRHPALVQS
jgi:hypothetical protein